LAEPLAALSLATDLAVGLPQESALRASILAVRLARLVGLPDRAIRDVYYASITRFLGCTATATEAASFALGEDISLYRSLLMCDWTDPDAVRDSVGRHVAPEAPRAERAAAFEAIREAHDAIPTLGALHCAQAMVLAERLPLPPGVTAVLAHMYDRWDGKVSGSAGEDIPITARVIPLAVSALLSYRVGGGAAARETVRARTGGQFDPNLCGVVLEDTGELFDGLDAPTCWDLFLASEPDAPVRIPETSVTDVAMVFADFVDQKSPYHLGHSRQVSVLVGRAAAARGLAASEGDELARAALAHDLGRAAVANGVWDKPGPLTAVERNHVRSHSWHTEHILSLTSAFGPSMASVASMTYERCDGSGYHRGIRLVEGPASLLAAADVYHALTHARPWRPAYEPRAASVCLIEEATAGRLARASVGAVLEAAGHSRVELDRSWPAGLTPREAEVLALLARGAPTKLIAATLGISPKTAGHHIERVYEKTGARGRAEVALFALKHNLFAP
jgi:HD-GYP domain-containing protein (c-di-GMP phosphodiesterase class II)